MSTTGRSFRRLRWIPILLVLLAAFPVGTASNSSLNHAGLVIRHGDGRLIYAYVPFTEPEISGVELLRRSGLSLVTVGFGGLGEGVCTIDGEGCSASECRTRVCQGSGVDAPFWQYFRQQLPGDWRALSLGASATKVRDGDIDGWSWTGRNPQLPAVTIDDIAELTGAGAEQPAGSSDVPAPKVATVVPPGYLNSGRDADDQDLRTYLAGGVIIVVAVGAAVVGMRRRSPSDTAP